MKSLRDDVEGIVIDAVGTLIEPRPPVAHVYRAAASRQGVQVEVDEVRRRFQRHFRNDEVDESRGPLVTDESIEFERWRRIVGNVLPEIADRERAFADLWAHFGRPEAWHCFADVGGAIRSFQLAGIPVRIASNFDARLHSVVAGLPEIAGLRDSLLVSSEVGFRKPHPNFYVAACSSLGLPAGRVLCVGDDPENDVQGPRRAGLQGLLLDRSGKHSGWPTSVPDLAALAAALGV